MKFISALTSWLWWKAAFARAVRTAAVIAVPYVPFIFDEGMYLITLSAAGFGAVTSLLTSLFGIPEATGENVPWFWALTERLVKTAAQATLTAFGTATVFSEVDWSAVGPAVAIAVLGSALLAVIKALPEAPAPTVEDGATVVVNVANPEGFTEDNASAVVDEIKERGYVG